MKQPNRLPSSGKTDRAKVIRFIFDGKSFEGYEGDTLASALLANNVHLVGRSFKYHRPRGILTAGSEEPNALVQHGVGGRSEPNIRMTQLEIYDGMVAESQNKWPSLKFDIQGVGQLFSRFLPAGFYYKTFMGPGNLWYNLWEPMIRRAAGLGKASAEKDPDQYISRYYHCDLLIVGGGIAGLSAALTAGQAGKQVLLCDERHWLGGALNAEGNSENIKPWLDEIYAKLKVLANVRILSRTTVTGYYDHNFLVAIERAGDHLGDKIPATQVRQRFWKIRAGHVMLATGAIERPMIFPDNDRPGILLAGALKSYIHEYGVLPGQRILVATNNDTAYASAIAAHKAGAKVMVADVRKNPDGQLVQSARDMGIEIHLNSAIAATKGHLRIKRVEIAEIAADGRELADGGGLSMQGQSFSIDLLASSGGWTPSVHLFSQSRGSLRYDDDRGVYLPNQSPQAVSVAGGINGCVSYQQAIDEAVQAIAAIFAMDDEAAQAISAQIISPVADIPEGAMQLIPFPPTRGPLHRLKAKFFHDQQNDATFADIMLAHREGFSAAEHMKRYTTTGMATDQGKTGNMHSLMLLADLRGETVPEVGVTTFRPPYTPVTFGAISGAERGDLWEPERTTAMHKAHVEAGAVFENVGDWLRPWYFPEKGETMDQAVQRETAAARKTVGMLDASTLGKIDIQGRDATKLLNMVYTNRWDTLKIGSCRYGLMCNEHGMVFDDGVTTRLAENHYHMTTTTGGAARVLTWLEEWAQTEWPDWEVYMTSVTEQWSVATITGPSARAMLSGLVQDIDLSNEAFPFMTVREGHIGDIPVPVRIFRISFTGDDAFEINVPARYGLSLWQMLMNTGKDYGLTLYGTESMHILRAEKGFIIVGQDSDGTVTPDDLGYGKMCSPSKDFIGKRSHVRADTARLDRKQLVGLLSEDPNLVIPEGAHIVAALKPSPPMETLGHVTSSYMSPNAGRSIALALLRDGRRRKGQKVDIALLDGRRLKAVVTDPVFLVNK